MRRAAALLKPTDRLFSDEWARRNREYGSDAPIPGPREPSLTPYIIPIERRIDARTHRRVAAVFGTQMSKTELALDVIGNRMDSSPVRMGYIMPSKKVLDEIIEPRIKELLKSTSLAAKASSRQTKGRKTINGVDLRLVPAGSASSLAADSLGLVITDEIDKFADNVKGQGNVVGLADRRGDAFPDFVHFSTSSPTEGSIESEVDLESGLEFWSMVDPDNLRSPIWSMWQGGTRHHWAFPCPHCEEYFIPRFKLMRWDKPKDREGNDLPSTPIMAKRTARMECPSCGDPIRDTEHLAEMNARGVYVAPGQSIAKDGTISGDEPDAWTYSFWVSGFASPLMSWGDRCAAYVEAAQSRDIHMVQAVVNGFGELFVPGSGDVPDWTALKSLRIEQVEGQVPDWVRLIVMTADVQKDGIYYIKRGWGAFGSSTLIEKGFLQGDTADKEVWNTLETVMMDPVDGVPTYICLIDSGYRPGKKFIVPHHMVYRFCRKFPNLAFATKGASNPMRTPILRNKIDVKIDGKEFKKGLDLRTLDTGYFKRWLLFKLQTVPEDQDAWCLPKDINEDYLRQMVAEVEITLPSGKTKWVQRHKANHFFDCESMQGAAFMMKNLGKLRAGPQMRVAQPRAKTKIQRMNRPANDEAAEAIAFDEQPPAASAPEVQQPARRKKGGKKESIW